MYAKVDTSRGTSSATLIGADWVALPRDLAGLQQSTLNDLSVVSSSRPDLNGIGYWPCTEIDASVPGKSVTDGTGSVTSIDTISMTAIRTYTVIAILPSEDHELTAAAAASTKAALIEQADAMAASGDVWGAVKLLLQAYGVIT